MKKYVSIKSRSIETSGITKDYKIAICEYIWNGLEANATDVRISFIKNNIGGIDEIIITDNGDGICYETLNESFGAFLASPKNTISTQIKSKKNQGKGRFAFYSFADKATWETIYQKEEKYYKYRIDINNIEKNAYDASLPEEGNYIEAGSVVRFTNIKNLICEDLEFDKLEKVLLEEFAWYLYLNLDKKIKIYLSDKAIDYTKYIDKELSVQIKKEFNGVIFDITLIIWREKIREKFCTYYLNRNNKLVERETTNFNRNTVDFNHSAFVQSSYFDEYFNSKNDFNEQINLIGSSLDGKPIKELKVFLQNLIDEKLHEYLLNHSEVLIDEMKKRGNFPKFSKDVYGQIRKKDFEIVIKELYCIESRIFYKLNPVQEKSLLGFLNLLLSSEERENVLDIVEEVVNLQPQQREEFVKILKKTKLENILDTIKFIESRYYVINGLKLLLYDMSSFTNERNNIQRIVENGYWLFGERYNLVSADKPMQTALEKYNYLLYGESEAKLTEDEEIQRRMDIFMCRKQLVEDSYDESIEENIIVELKAPNVKLTKKVYRQIEDYMSFIIRQPQFNSQLRRWKFIAVCKEIDDDIKNRYAAFKDKGKKFLVFQVENYEVYAMTWDDIFKSFELRHGFVLDKLKYDCSRMIDQFESDSSTSSKDFVNNLTKKIVSIC